MATLQGVTFEPINANTSAEVQELPGSLVVQMLSQASALLDAVRLESQRLLKASRRLLYGEGCERVLPARVQHGHPAEHVLRAHEHHHNGGRA